LLLLLRLVASMLHSAACKTLRLPRPFLHRVRLLLPLLLLLLLQLHLCMVVPLQLAAKPSMQQYKILKLRVHVLQIHAVAALAATAVSCNKLLLLHQTDTSELQQTLLAKAHAIVHSELQSSCLNSWCSAGHLPCQVLCGVCWVDRAASCTR
jgi:hypothetical protein